MLVFSTAASWFAAVLSMLSTVSLCEETIGIRLNAIEKLQERLSVVGYGVYTRGVIIATGKNGRERFSRRP